MSGRIQYFLYLDEIIDIQLRLIRHFYYLYILNFHNMLGANLKFLRKLKGLSQQDLAKALSLPRTTLGDYERSHTEPNLLMLKKISKYFDVSLDQLIRG